MKTLKILVLVVSSTLLWTCGALAHAFLENIMARIDKHENQCVGKPKVFPRMASAINCLLVKSILRGFCLFCLGAVVSIQPVLSCDVSDDTNFSRSAALARNTNRPLLLAFIGTDWSISSLKLDREVFDQAEFADNSNYNFLLCKLHFYQTREEFPDTFRHNEELATKYQVEEFPTVVVLSPDGREIGRLGYIPGGVKAFAAAVNAIVSRSRQQEQH